MLKVPLQCDPGCAPPGGIPGCQLGGTPGLPGAGFPGAGTEGVSSSIGVLVVVGTGSFVVVTVVVVVVVVGALVVVVGSLVVVVGSAVVVVTGRSVQLTKWASLHVNVLTSKCNPFEHS